MVLDLEDNSILDMESLAVLDFKEGLSLGIDIIMVRLNQFEDMSWTAKLNCKLSRLGKILIKKSFGAIKGSTSTNSKVR